MSGRSVAVAVAGVVAIALVLYAGLYARRSETPAVVPTATATPTGTSLASATPTPTATPSAGATQVGTISTPCQNMSFQAGDMPIVAPRRLGQHLQVALDAVRPGTNGGNRWLVRFFVPEGAPAAVEISLRATVTGPAGPLQTGAYEAGPPNSETVPVTGPVAIQPCVPPGPARPASGAIVVGVQTTAVRSGTYTLAWSDIRLPEGGTRSETWTVTLTCTIAPSAPGTPPATECK